MSIMFARAHVDRAETKAKGPLRVVLATEGMKGDGIDLRLTGARLDRFRANPIVGYGHSYWGRDDLPVGRVDDLAVDGGALTGNVTFDPGDEFAMRLDNKYRTGIMSAFSVGFAVHAWEDGKSEQRGGGVAVDWELHELSSVPVPLDPGAIVVGGRSLYLPAHVRGEVTELIQAALGVRGFVTRDELPDILEPLINELNPVPETPAGGLDPVAARALLAAFTPKEGGKDE